MARQVFFSFHYDADSWQASKIRNIGAIEGNKPASDNEWEEIKEEGEEAVKEWIDEQVSGRSCTIVLIGGETAGRKWIKYEIKKTWKEEMGLLGIYIHNIKDEEDNQTTKGDNPFSAFVLNEDPLEDIVKAYDPPRTTSKGTYSYIKDNIEDWIGEAIETQENY